MRCQVAFVNAEGIVRTGLQRIVSSTGVGRSRFADLLETEELARLRVMASRPEKPCSTRFGPS